MSEVKRYDFNGQYMEMRECEDGEYVKFEEYEKLKSQLEKAESSLNKAINAADFFSRYADCDKDTWACRCEFCRDTTTTIKLREAREYFKEKESK